MKCDVGIVMREQASFARHYPQSGNQLAFELHRSDWLCGAGTHRLGAWLGVTSTVAGHVHNAQPEKLAHTNDVKLSNLGHFPR